MYQNLAGKDGQTLYDAVLIKIEKDNIDGYRIICLQQSSKIIERV